MHAKVWDVSAADWVLWPQGAVAWWFFDPVVSNALRAVGHPDYAALFEPEGLKRAPHRGVVLMGVAAQVIRMLRRKAEDRASNVASAYRGHSVDDIVGRIRMPRTIDLCLGFVRPRNKRKDSHRTLVVSRDVGVPSFNGCSDNIHAGVTVGPLCGVPVHLHERPGMRIRARDELEVVRVSDSNLHASMIGGVTGY